MPAAVSKGQIIEKSWTDYARSSTSGEMDVARCNFSTYSRLWPLAFFGLHMLLNYQSFTEMTSKMVYIIAFGGGL